MKTLLTFCLFLFLLVSCGKERSIKIKAINAATGQPYSGLEYRVASSRTAANGVVDFYGGPNVTYLSSYTANVGGNDKVIVACEEPQLIHI